MAWAATAAELVFRFALILGLFTRVVAFLSGILLLAFALAMTFSLGIKAPLDFSVFSASAGGFLLAAFDQYPWTLDRARQLRRKNESAGTI
jgi:putative oxidoreductase